VLNVYNYKCFRCKKEYSPAEIESQFVYLCPNCGRAREKKPLFGALLVNYDYEALETKYNSEFFFKITAGQFWKYPALWPLNISEDPDNPYEFIDTSKLNRLTTNANPLQKISDALSVFDDTLNPTLSYKDRASILVCVKAIELGIKDIATASTGNAASSLAGICARLGLNAHIFVPKSIPQAKLIQIQSYGASVYLVEGTYDDAFDLCNEICKSKGWFNRNTAYNPLTIEGKKSAAYDIYISSRGNLPRSIFVPVGDGVIISGLFKGFEELEKLNLIEKMPTLVAVQAEGSNAVVRYINGKNFEPIPTNTLADSIDAETPKNLFMAAHAIVESDGYAISVGDDEIMESQKELALDHGVLCEPSAAAAYTGYKIASLSKLVDENENSLLMITGNGLKDLGALETWTKTPEVKTVDDWKDILSK
jgi:threonine synthase